MVSYIRDEASSQIGQVGVQYLVSEKCVRRMEYCRFLRGDMRHNF